MKNRIKSLLITSFIIIALLLATPASAIPTTTVSIADVTIEPGSNITLPINIVNIEDYGTGTINIEYDPAVVHVTGVASSSDSTVIAKKINNSIECNTCIIIIRRTCIKNFNFFSFNKFL